MRKRVIALKSRGFEASKCIELGFLRGSFCCCHLPRGFLLKVGYQSRPKELKSRGNPRPKDFGADFSGHWIPLSV